MKEADLMRLQMLALSKEGHLALRANVGMAWTGDVQKLPDGSLLIRNPRPFKTGLPSGFSDVFGFTVDCRPFFMETKTTTGVLSPDQLTFLQAMKARGAIAGVARSVDEAVEMMRKSHQPS